MLYRLLTVDQAAALPGTEYERLVFPNDACLLPATGCICALGAAVQTWISEQDGEAGLAECLDAMTRAQLVNRRDGAELGAIRQLLEILVTWGEDPAWFEREAENATR